MATIERKPLPPPGSTTTRITEADRAEIIARANDVIDFYLNGPGSYFDAGPRKPLAGEGDTTVADLNRFKDSVLASKQYADDPAEIMDSVVDLIRRAIDGVERADQDNYTKDRILRPPPDINDPISHPRALGAGRQGRSPLPISMPSAEAQAVPPSRAATTPRASADMPARVLSSRIANLLQPSTFDANGINASRNATQPQGESTDAALLESSAGSMQGDSHSLRLPLSSAGSGVSRQTDPRNVRILSGYIAAPDGSLLPLLNQKQAQQQPSGPLGVVTGQPMPDYRAPSVFGLPDRSAASGGDIDDWFSRWIKPLTRQ